jgi:hypothetical protein
VFLAAQGIREELLFGKTGSLIEAMDKISDTIGHEVTLSFPQIIVAGQESSGKSSVLERIAMLNFFPRSDDICTRMPILLQLKHLSKDNMKTFCASNNLTYTDTTSVSLIKAERTSNSDVIKPCYWISATRMFTVIVESIP